MLVATVAGKPFIGVADSVLVRVDHYSGDHVGEVGALALGIERPVVLYNALVEVENWRILALHAVVDHPILPGASQL